MIISVMTRAIVSLPLLKMSSAKSGFVVARYVILFPFKNLFYNIQVHFIIIYYKDCFIFLEIAINERMLTHRIGG